MSTEGRDHHHSGDTWGALARARHPPPTGRARQRGLDTAEGQCAVPLRAVRSAAVLRRDPQTRSLQPESGERILRLSTRVGFAALPMTVPAYGHPPPINLRAKATQARIARSTTQSGANKGDARSKTRRPPFLARPIPATRIVAPATIDETAGSTPRQDRECGPRAKEDSEPQRLCPVVVGLPWTLFEESAEGRRSAADEQRRLIDDPATCRRHGSHQLEVLEQDVSVVAADRREERTSNAESAREVAAERPVQQDAGCIPVGVPRKGIEVVLRPN